MADKFVLAVHTETKLLQRVPKHFLDAFPYFKLAPTVKLEKAQAPKPKPVQADKTKEGAK